MASAHTSPPPHRQHHKRLWSLHILAAILTDVNWYLNVVLPFSFQTGVHYLALATLECKFEVSLPVPLSKCWDCRPTPGFTVALMGICLVPNVIFIAWCHLNLCSRPWHLSTGFTQMTCESPWLVLETLTFTSSSYWFSTVLEVFRESPEDLLVKFNLL